MRKLNKQNHFSESVLFPSKCVDKVMSKIIFLVSSYRQIFYQNIFTCMSHIHVDLSANEDFGTSALVGMHEILVIQKTHFVCHEMNRSAVNAS